MLKAYREVESQVEEALFDLMSNVVFFVKDAAGRYVRVNDTLVHRSGKSSRSELIGLTPSEVFGECLGACYEAQDEAVLRSGTRLIDELEMHVYPSGDMGWCLTSKIPLRDSQGNVVALAGISRDLRPEVVVDDGVYRISSAVEYARAHLSDPPTLAQMAAAASMSIYQLDRRMKQLFDLTPGQWLLKIRIDHASRELLQSDLPIAQIAMNAGYADQGAFTRQFRKTTGQTPSRFRQFRA